MQTVNDLLSLIRRGAETVGAPGGAALGSLLAFVSGTPEGAATGAAVGSLVGMTFTNAVADIAERVLSNRERNRLGVAAFEIAVRMKERVDAGEQPRDDGFFDRDQTGRSDADEILEGVLLKCKNEFREKKLRFLCSIAANAPFTDVPSETLNDVILVAEAMTYRQLCLLALLGRADQFRFNTTALRPRALEKTMKHEEHREAFLRDLHQLGVYGHRVIDYGVDAPVTYNYGGPVELSGLGRDCFQLMGLKDVTRSDLESLKANFRMP